MGKPFAIFSNRAIKYSKLTPEPDSTGGENQKKKKGVPKGFLAVKVGLGEKQQRFVVPVLYFNHPLLIQLWKESEEEECGFDPKGTITIHCHVEEFKRVYNLIDRNKIRLQHVSCFGL
ncbi:auxin-responsive protein SAUR32 [Trifolium repens]|nr:auxin-responsive protein SAUR32 [Trifolium repens]